jgi:putative restriction endonuclease
LGGENGLLLTPTVHHLFDRGYISFTDDGDMLVSPLLGPGDLERLGILTATLPNVGSFSTG